MRAQEFVVNEVKARYEMTDLDPWTFDQTPAGWRGLPSSARQADAINQYIDRYVKDGQFVGAPEGVKTVRPYILYWHLGQVLTQMGRNGMASRVMRQALDDGFPDWNAYVMATISFLRKDRRDFDHWAPLARGNEETIKRLTAGWGLPYKQAYAGQSAVAEVSPERLQTYLSRAGQQVDRRQERMAQARERLNKGYEIYHAEDPTRIVHRFEANTPAEAKRYYERYNANYDSDVDYDLRLRRGTGIMESTSNKVSVADMIAYLKTHHDPNLHQDYTDYIENTFDHFVLKNVPTNSIPSELPKLDREKVERYRQMDFSKAPPIVIGDRYILDGYHRLNAAKVLGIPSIRAYVGVKKVAEGYARKLNFDEIYGKYLKVTDNNGDPNQSGFSLVTPLNGASWNWRERPEFIPVVKKKLNQPGWLGDHKYQQIIDAMAGKPFDPKRHLPKEINNTMKSIREYINLVESAQTAVDENKQGQLPMSGGELKIVFVDPDQGAKVVGKANSSAQVKKIIQDKFNEIYDTGDRLRKVAANIFVLEPDYENTGERATADNYEHFYHWIVQ